MGFHAHRVDALLRPLAIGQVVQAFDNALLVEVDGRAPPACAIARRSGTLSMAMTCFAPSRIALRMVICPTGPQPHMATVSVGWMSHCTAACQPVGKMSPRNSTCSSERPFAGTLMCVLSAYGTRTYSAWPPG